ncbi:1-phosphofructokinase family hexose kinase [Thalassoroseus pseudoceratinae]|uniref:1-phosphofructokinase family hexose kinase n=1 Tax=Thalassoroseus pseudoceratinae TaxID=2713176 RepID=UPI00141E0B15|nr:hexose kinase [Thalassoroseus pseudoceratinae]
MIVTAGLSPAWQQILTFRSFELGHVNRAKSAHWCASGKVLNVGLALHRLCGHSRVLCVTDDGPAGTAMQAEYERQSVPTHWIKTQAVTRVCTTLLDEHTEQTTELVENAPSLNNDDLERFCEAFALETREATVVVLTGSLPSGVPSDFYRRLIESTSAAVIMDARGPELSEALRAKPFLVKPNVSELSKTVRRPLENEEQIWDAMRELQSQGAVSVVVSRGEEPMLAVFRDQRFVVHPATESVVNPIGCGDCLAAGIAWQLSRGSEFPALLKYGSAAAAANLQQLLPARIDVARVEELSHRVQVEQI